MSEQEMMNQNTPTGHPEQQLRVLDIAKELGMEPLKLLDALLAMNIKVKSHMSELSAGDIQTVRSSFGKKPAAAGKKSASTKTRKKADKSPPAKHAAVKQAAVPPTEAQSEEKKAAAALVIRRRAKADGEMETVVPQQPQDSEPQTDVAYSDGTLENQQEPETPAGDDPSTTRQLAAPAAETAPQQGAEEPSVEETSGTAAAAPEPSLAATETMPASAPTPKTRTPIVLTPRPVAPRRSILKIVTAAPPPLKPMIKPVQQPETAASAKPRTTIKGTTTQDKDGFRIIKMTKENLDQMVEEEAARKRGGGREHDIRPEDVKFADYRKKEMVFLPKKKKIPVGKEIRQTKITTPRAVKRVVEMGDTITVQDLSNQLGVKASEVIRKLMGMGQMATINQAIDMDTTTLIAAEYQYEVRNVAFKEDDLLVKTEDDASHLQPRPPVVTVMGHVDHGKTSLLDAIRESDVAAGEAGGITQHIGAYTIEKDGKLITFIDTPGHEAFTNMRARGANVTDIVVLVVAADDGVMPQTREALSHAQSAGVPIIVAVNKIDKQGANPDKIKQGLAELNLLAEDWGGQSIFVNVSALKKTNIDKLLESILLQAEVLELKSNPSVRASGVVLEARLEKGRGPVMSVLVKRGTLRIGDPIVCGTFDGKVKAMMDHSGKMVKEAKPGFAVEVLGLNGIPNSSDNIDVTPTDTDAQKIAEHRLQKVKGPVLAQAKVSLDDLFARIQSGNTKELSIILKADVFGSMEAIRESLIKLSTEKVKVNVIFAAAGGITESDVLLATASKAIIIGFNVRPEIKAKQVAESEHVEIKTYSIIYELIDDIRKSMTGLLDKKKVEKYLGRAEVRQTFSVPKIGVIAGSSVIDGKFQRGASVRLLRDSRVIYDGKLGSLKRFKDDAKEVATGFECGISIENYNDIKQGDIIEAYMIELVEQELGV